MNAPPSCRTCVRFRKCMEALRYYPCVDYERKKLEGNERKNVDSCIMEDRRILQSRCK